jgi:hypothetical protein
VTDDAGDRRDAAAVSFGFRHEHKRRRAIGDAARIGRRHGAAFAESGFSFGILAGSAARG